MALWQSLPFACVMVPLIAAALVSLLPRPAARAVTLAVLALVTAASAAFVPLVAALGDSYTYPMGFIGAPWGNELRAGPLEALFGAVFSLVMLLSALGGLRTLDGQLLRDRHSLYDVTLLLLCASLMAQIYTNDLFTAYVFVEIMTLAGVTLIAAKGSGRPLVAAVRYMIMNAIGSALFLLGIVLLLDLTGHLLMEPLHGALQALLPGLEAGARYRLTLTVVVALMSVGLAVKGALFPFHTWVPDAYSASAPTSAAVLAGLVSKGYILILLKLMLRVLGQELIAATHVADVLFVLAAAGMLGGSLLALLQKDLRRMLAYSSVAQIGYIFLGLALGTEQGMAAACCHILVHACAKAMLFLSAARLAEGGSFRLDQLRGAACRAPLAGAAFTAGALSLAGLPLLGGFVSKLSFALAGVAAGGAVMVVVLSALVLSTLLQIGYLFRAALLLWARPAEGEPSNGAAAPLPRDPALAVSLTAFLLLNLALGLLGQPLLSLIRSGLIHFT